MQPWKLDLQQLPGAVREVAAALAGGGGRVFLVGGSVRDLLRGQRLTDFDLATDLPPARIAALLPHADTRDARLGTVAVHDREGPIVVTALREEADYRDHRHPEVIRFVTTPAQDAVRRDFTVNTLYADFTDGRILDPAGGLPDLASGVLRVIGDGQARFAEDPLRVLRCVRFCARLGFQLDPLTRTAVLLSAPLLSHLAAERVFAELTAAFTGPGRGRALQLFVELGAAAVLLPEVAALASVTQPPEYHPEGCVLTHAALVLDRVPAGNPVLSWTAVLHDLGKPPTWRQAEDRIRFDGHDVLSARMADAVLQRLRSSSELREQVVEISREHIRFAALPGMRPRRRERFLRQPLFAQHLAFHRADCLGSHGDLQLHDRLAAEWRGLPELTVPLVTGADVLALGIAPGPRVGQLLREVERALDDSAGTPTRAEAMELLSRFATASVKPGP